MLVGWYFKPIFRGNKIKIIFTILVTLASATLFHGKRSPKMQLLARLKCFA